MDPAGSGLETVLDQYELNPDRDWQSNPSKLVYMVDSEIGPLKC